MKKSRCIELVLIFEFSLSITPTTIGGSAVSLFVLTQERLSAARTTTIVLYKVVLDTMFFVGTFPFLFLLNGAEIIAPISHHPQQAHQGFAAFGIAAQPEQILSGPRWHGAHRIHRFDGGTVVEPEPCEFFGF